MDHFFSWNREMLWQVKPAYVYVLDIRWYDFCELSEMRLICFSNPCNAFFLEIGRIALIYMQRTDRISAIWLHCSLS